MEWEEPIPIILGMGCVATPAVVVYLVDFTADHIIMADHMAVMIAI